MPHLVEPFIKEPVHRLTRRLFDGDAKLRSLNRLVCVPGQVVIDGAPPIVFAKERAQHVQDRSAARISVSVKDRVRVGVMLRHDWATLAAIPSRKILVLI